MGAHKRADFAPAERAPPPAADAAARSSGRRPAPAFGDEPAVNSPAHALQARLLASYQEADSEKWSPAVRLRLILALASAPWALIGGAAFLLLKASR